MDQSVAEFQQRIAQAKRAQSKLCIRGAGTKDWYGQTLQGDVLDTRSHHGIIEYEPTELVITARCGTPLAELEAVLAEQQQMLAFEPPHFGAGATVGGMVVSGLSGPRRQAAGAVRDFVLGAVLLDGVGNVLHFGGQVMKNVAGYDVSRLLAGSLGTLGIVLEVSLKVLPMPVAQITLAFDADESEAINLLNQWGGQALPISASAWADGTLAIRLGGAQAAVASAVQRLGGEVIDDANDFWNSLREHTHPLFADDGQALWRLSVPSVAAPLNIAGSQLIEWGGAQRWVKTDASAASLRSIASRLGGHATLFRGGDKSCGVFQPLAPSVEAIHRHLKNAFDPSGIFNPGRMYPHW